MSSKKDLALTAATAVAPEIAIPVREALAIAGRLSSKSPRRETEAQGDVLLVPPPEKPLLIVLRKQRVHVRRKAGVRIVTVDPERGLTTTETVVVGTVALVAYGAYLAGKAVQKDLGAIGLGGGGNPILKKLGL